MACTSRTEFDGLIKVIKDYLGANDKDAANWGALGDVYVLKGDNKTPPRPIRR